MKTKMVKENMVKFARQDVVEQLIKDGWTVEVSNAQQDEQQVIIKKQTKKRGK